MRELFSIPRKFFVSQSMQDSLSRSPLVIADVGSAMGLDTRWAPVREYLEVLSFEPDARSDGDGTIFRTALGSAKKEAQTLYLSSLPAASSLYRHHPEMQEFVVKEWLEETGESPIPVSTLDECVSERKIDFLKIDVEGADLDVLFGAEKALQHVLAIQIEVSFADRHIDAPGFSEIDLHLRERGFRLHSVSPEHWMRDCGSCGPESQLQLIWGDALYLSEKMRESNYEKWALILQAYGLHDYAISKLPARFKDPILRSIRTSIAFLAMVSWRLALATLCLPFFGKRAWIKWKRLNTTLFGELYRLSRRCGPKNGILPHE